MKELYGVVLMYLDGSLRYGANQTRPDDFGAWDVYP